MSNDPVRSLAGVRVSSPMFVCVAAALLLSAFRAAPQSQTQPQTQEEEVRRALVAAASYLADYERRIGAVTAEERSTSGVPA